MVLRESPRLVRKDVLYLPQVFADVESSALKRSVTWGVVHVPVPVDEVDLNELDNLNRDIQRDWNDDLK